MLGPYRESLVLVADPLPCQCVPEGAASRCPLLRAAPRVRSRWVAAVSSAATLLLLVASASLGAIAWTVIAAPLAGRARLPGFVADDLPAAPFHAPVPPAFGAERHDVDAVWARARRQAARGSGLTLARATVAPEALSLGAGDATRVVHEKHGLRLVAVDDSSSAALLGLRRGDLVTAINGRPLRRPEDAARAYDEVISGHGVVVELLRAGRPVALRVDAALAAMR